ncbi:hypothetical protein A5757_19380 [Mycobacterium sp. 852013-51886_SCH5428379]|uniref:AAA family ATPase n=1 Tax=Mycobacterium sp. 852013-51886_SCH5428379 TaxID=1834111 RepID=UPI0008007B9E|nr:LuxR C-terminal-related transcriptional regulator [Mycobacterium sp. 852013-51886_SCH5428379]OBB57978.1 hypothetical protein A5757_19380 [Mycobacterium sp. 852013-51886_SCH5428379]
MVGVGEAALPGALEQFLARASAGPAALVVGGEAGIGKTTLWSTAVDRARDAGFLVLASRGTAAEAVRGYAAVADLLAGVSEEALAELPPIQRLALDRVLLRDGDRAGATDQYVVAATFRGVVEALARTEPVLIAIDDAQWLDSPSRTVVAFTARRLAGRIGVLATVRTGDTVASVDWLQLPRPELLAHIEVGPMDAAALRSVIESRTGHTLPRSVVAHIHRIAGGNPFYALELARPVIATAPDYIVGLPDSLSCLIDDRLDGLPSETADALLTAACSAAPTVEQVAAALGVSGEDVAAALAPAEARGVVRLDGLRVQFAHPLLAHGVYTRADADRRRATHRRLAEFARVPEVRARHLCLGTAAPDEATLRALDSAADAASARGAPSVAAELLDMAIALGGSDPVRELRAAEQLFRSGAHADAGLRLDRLLPDLQAGVLRAVALMLRGAVHGYGDSIGDAVAALTEAVANAADHPPLLVQSQLLLALAVGLTGDMTASVAHARAAYENATPLDDPTVLSQAAALWCHVSFMHGYGLDRDTLQLAADAENHDVLAPVTLQATAVQAALRAWSGELVQAHTEMAAVEQRCAERGNDVDAIWAADFMTMIELWLGRYDDAAEAADRVRARAEEVGVRHSRITALICQAAVAAHRGRADEARGAARAGIAAARASGHLHYLNAAITWLAAVDVAQGRHRAAVAELQPLLADFDADHGTEIVVGGFLPDAVEALIATNDHQRAEALISALETNGERHDRPWMSGAGARGRAHLRWAQGDLDGAQRAAEQALDHHERLPMPAERARTLLLLGQIQRRHRQRSAATENLTAAVRVFTDLGSELWAQRALTELQRLQYGSRYGGQLTPTEARVARLAADGLSNREIAAELFLAVKTVEMTLSRVYRKLSVRSRSQLHGALKGGD